MFIAVVLLHTFTHNVFPEEDDLALMLGDIIVPVILCIVMYVSTERTKKEYEFGQKFKKVSAVKKSGRWFTAVAACYFFAPFIAFWVYSLTTGEKEALIPVGPIIAYFVIFFVVTYYCFWKPFSKFYDKETEMKETEENNDDE
ncbi:MAG: hypothetical protein FWE80_08070, partial [Oscillospiraceae bacterium]|nr:hypothetical protein [Oscillospiraceae bacterium]